MVRNRTSYLPPALRALGFTLYKTELQNRLTVQQHVKVHIANRLYSCNIAKQQTPGAHPLAGNRETNYVDM